jgi:hypothetical protein
MIVDIYPPIFLKFATNLILEVCDQFATNLDGFRTVVARNLNKT